ncbi:hypothetical protein AZ268_gp40 [Acidianus rod-shaped virus 2]|uniref:Uncharacterized protein n=1 Tax=Acidianus rod-shaped virus 2 TaxID=1732175 RepID=A0A0N7FYY4_9VIRU|nr:hypothetical protein AZ268_gp40 [Acidianus rod-shaped virus 2]ALG96908.1 hypothetical protein [Acidianus rod-shaped virus 2]
MARKKSFKYLKQHIDKKIVVWKLNRKGEVLECIILEPTGKDEYILLDWYDSNGQLLDSTYTSDYMLGVKSLWAVMRIPDEVLGKLLFE